MSLRNLLPYFVMPFMILTLIYMFFEAFKGFERIIMLFMSFIVVSITTYFVFKIENDDFIYEN